MDKIGDRQFCDDFLRGERDCLDTGTAKENQSKEYYRGFETRYAAIEALTALEIQYGFKKAR